MIKVFLDASVIISGINSSSGASFFVLTLCQKRKVAGYISPLIVKEVIRNLKRKFSKEKLSLFLNFLAESNFKKVTFKSEAEIKKYQHLFIGKDIHVLAGAIKAKVDYLVTLDKKHLLTLSNKNLGFKIITPIELLRTIIK